MKFSPRSLFLAPVVLAAAALATSTAGAQATVKVPFNFAVAGQICPGGVYVVRHDSRYDSVTLRNLSSAQSFTWNLRQGDPDPTDTRVMLKFDAKGPLHILQSVQYESQTTGRLDKPSRKPEPPVDQLARGQ